MQTITRTTTRDSSERRVNDRRQVDYEFGSPEWIEHVKKNYVAWPKVDRRQATRRTAERRQDGSQSQHLSNSSNPLEIDYSSDLLTQDERIFFDNLFKKDES